MTYWAEPNAGRPRMSPRLCEGLVHHFPMSPELDDCQCGEWRRQFPHPVAKRDPGWARLMARLRYWLVPEFTLSDEEEQ